MNITNTTSVSTYDVAISEDALIDATNEWISSCQFSFVVLIFLFLLFFIFYAKACHFILSHFCIFGQHYISLDEIKQRKIIIYLSSIIIRAPAGVLVFILLAEYWTLEDGMYIDDCWGIQIVQLVTVAYSTLMIFEMIKLPELSWDMFVHHMIIIILSITLMDQSILDLPFRTDAYYVEITISLVLGGSIMFFYQIFWVYFHLLKFDKSTIIGLKRLKTQHLMDLKVTSQTSINAMMTSDTLQPQSKYFHYYSGLEMQNRRQFRQENEDSMSIHGRSDDMIIQPSSKADNKKNNNNNDNGNEMQDEINETKRKKFDTIDSLFAELHESNMTYDNLKLNRDSTKMKKNILKFRLIFLVFVIVFFFGGFPIILWIQRTIDDSYQKEGTKWFLFVIILLNLFVEIYVFRLLYKIYQSQVKKYRKYKMAIDTFDKKQKATIEMEKKQNDNIDKTKTNDEIETKLIGKNNNNSNNNSNNNNNNNNSDNFESKHKKTDENVGMMPPQSVLSIPIDTQSIDANHDT